MHFSRSHSARLIGSLTEVLLFEILPYFGVIGHTKLRKKIEIAGNRKEFQGIYALFPCIRLREQGCSRVPLRMARHQRLKLQGCVSCRGVPNKSTSTWGDHSVSTNNFAHSWRLCVLLTSAIRIIQLQGSWLIPAVKISVVLPLNVQCVH